MKLEACVRPLPFDVGAGVLVLVGTVEWLSAILSSAPTKWVRYGSETITGLRLLISVVIICASILQACS